MLSAPRSPYLLLRRLSLAVFLTATLVGGIAPNTADPVLAQQAAPNRQPLRLDADNVEANAVTGVITARGNVRINYPARQIQATSVQAQYYSRENRIVLSGDVYVLQEGNSLRGETITYLVDEGRFVALPNTGEQVQSIYLVPDPNAPVTTSAATTVESTADPTAETQYNPKPEFKTPISPQ